MSPDLVVIVRHAETYDNARAFRTTLAGDPLPADAWIAPPGVDPGGLNPCGHAQAAALARCFRRRCWPFARVLCSPTTRTKQTLDCCLQGGLGFSRQEVEYLDDLVELSTEDDHGPPLDRTGADTREIERDRREHRGRHGPMGYGDNSDLQACKAGPASALRVARLVHGIRSCPAGTSVLVIGHSRINAQLILSLAGGTIPPWPRQDNACLNILPLLPGRRHADTARTRINVLDHLDDALVRRFTDSSIKV